MNCRERILAPGKESRTLSPVNGAYVTYLQSQLGFHDRSDVNWRGFAINCFWPIALPDRIPETARIMQSGAQS
jgi:hypothetical protein